MSRLTRRNFVKRAGVTATAAFSRESLNIGVRQIAVSGESAGSFPGSRQVASEAMERELAPQQIYHLLGFATMSGEDPLKLCTRPVNPSFALKNIQ